MKVKMQISKHRMGKSTRVTKGFDKNRILDFRLAQLIHVVGKLLGQATFLSSLVRQIDDR